MAQVGLLEDNPRIAHLCATLLHHVGHQVTLYDHPLDCLRALQVAETVYGGKMPVHRPVQPIYLPIDVLVLDLRLPDIDGVEVLQYLRSRSHTRFLPVVCCTAASAAEIARAKMMAPHATFVEKPFRLDVLTSAITRVLNAQVS